MDCSDVTEVEELSEQEFPHNADSARFFPPSVFQYFHGHSSKVHI